MTNLEISTCIVYFNFKVALEKKDKCNLINVSEKYKCKIIFNTMIRFF